MKNIVYLFIFLLSIISFSQTVNLSDLKLSDIENMTDIQVKNYWSNAQKKGYSLNDLDALAKLQNVSPTIVSALRSRISNLQNVKVASETLNLERSETPLEKGVKLGASSDNGGIFGFNFFSNSKISFEPNLSLATPKNYQIGPKDELIISVWGAAENNYDVRVNPDGSIRIPGVGPVFISGMPIELASKKIKSTLKKIYNGIDLSDSNPYKVYVDISLSNVRRVQIDIIGEVKAPATYSLSALSTVMNALYAAGGPNVNGSFRNVLHTRNGNVIGNLDIYEYLINGKLTGNNTLEDQDVIIVRPFKKRVRIRGQVKRPGKFELKEDETFSNLLEYSGGFTSRAFKDIISINRIEDGQLAVKDIKLNDRNVVLKDGDQINVSGIIEKYKNRVTIQGGVNKPGDYELEENFELSDLINKAFGVRGDAFLDRGLLYRTAEDGITKISKSFSVRKVLDKQFNMRLKNNDRVVILEKGSQREDGFIKISGAVKTPRKLPYTDSLSIKDAITIAGGFKIGANPSVVDVYRLAIDDNYETESERFKNTLTSNFEISPEDDFYLKPNDRISVRYLKGFSKLKNIQILGEVQYPGNYAIENKNDKVSDVLKTAGGLSPYAFPRGATLQRVKSKNKLNKEQTNVLENVLDKGVIEPEIERVSIGLDLEKIINGGENSKYDFILQEGDIITIPNEKQTVQVKGEVLLPNVIRYDSGLSLRSYVNYSGGFTSKAKRGKSYVVYANGKVKATKKFLFFKIYPKLEPGAIILVPSRPERTNRLGVQESLGLVTSLGTLAIIIDRVSN